MEGTFMSEFVVSKNINDIIEFDRDHQKVRFLLHDPTYIFYYKDIQSCGVSEEVDHHNKGGSIINFSVGSFVRPDEYLRVGIRLKGRFHESHFLYVSKEKVKRDSLQYHDDIATAKRIVTLLRKCRDKAHE